MDDLSSQSSSSFLYAVTAVLIPIGYVGSLYVFDREYLHQHHPRTIRRRFIGVGVCTFVAFGVTYRLLGGDYAEPRLSMGLHIDGEILRQAAGVSASVLALYAGTILMELNEAGAMFSLTRCSWFDLNQWHRSLLELGWWKTFVVAPLTEEIAFRGCSAALLRHAYGSTVAMYCAPAFFAACHYHHLWDDVRQGETWSEAITERTLQAAYTYAFGVYATQLAFSTGSLVAPIIVHAICNRFGLPRLFDVHRIKSKRHRAFVYAAHILGLSVFVYCNFFIQ